jgi:secreted trypsin-like serine protease
VYVEARLDGGSTQCSGALISATEVLTAAHCAQSDPSRYRVFAGWSQGPDGQSGPVFDQVRPVSAVRVHPGYNAAAGYLDDVAVLELPEPFDLGPRVSPIVVADRFPRRTSACACTASACRTSESSAATAWCCPRDGRVERRRCGCAAAPRTARDAVETAARV